MRRDNSGELHSELKNRLSMVQADGTLKKAEQSERKELVHVQTSVAHQNVSQVDTGMCKESLFLTSLLRITV